jgi:hypothetical protein
MKVLLISPLHDIPTILSNRAVRDLTDWMDKRGIDYTHLWGFSAHRLPLTLLRLNRYDATFYYGHGREDRLGGWDIDILPIISKGNIHKFKDQIIYTMACLSGKELAPYSIKKGVKAFFGHNVRYFAFIERVAKKYNYFKDWVKLINLIPKCLMLGDTARKAMETYEQQANILYRKYLHIDKGINLKILYSNAFHLQLYGDKTGTINFK